MIDAYMVYEGANDSSILKFKPATGSTEILRELSENAVAWLTVDDTRIDYPVMQGKTNGEYLIKILTAIFHCQAVFFSTAETIKISAMHTP